MGWADRNRSEAQQVTENYPRDQFKADELAEEMTSTITVNVFECLPYLLGGECTRDGGIFEACPNLSTAPSSEVVTQAVRVNCFREIQEIRGASWLRIP
jgi:hypothetical protein